MDQKLVIERARASDQETIQHLYLQLVKDSNIKVEAQQIERISKDECNYLFVGRLGDQTIATAFLTICLDVMYGDQPYAVLENVVIDSEFRGLGLGRQLMEYIKSTCKQMKCTKIMLLSSSKRTEAHAFFERLGYNGDAKRAFVNYINR